jgi:hypothetical protein
VFEVKIGWDGSGERCECLSRRGSSGLYILFLGLLVYEYKEPMRKL